MSKPSARPAGVPIDYDVWIIKATDLMAADSNGKSDPYPLIYRSIAQPSKLDRKLARKYYVRQKTLNPVWDQSFVRYIGSNPDSKFTVEIYDKDLITDDFLGMVEFDIKDHAGKGPVDLPLQPRPDKKKDKVKGTVTIDVRVQGAESGDLGFSLIKYYAEKLTGNSKLDSMAAVRLMFSTYKELAGSKGGITAQEWVKFQEKFTANRNSVEEIKAVQRIYDDDGDGLTNFYELMSFLGDGVAQTKQGSAGKARFTIVGAFSAMIEDGKVDADTLRLLLQAFVPNPETRDAEKMKEAIDDAVKEVLEGLDSNKDGQVTMKELREYVLDTPAMETIIRQLHAIPKKPEEKK